MYNPVCLGIAAVLTYAAMVMSPPASDLAPTLSGLSRPHEAVR